MSLTKKIAAGVVIAFIAVVWLTIFTARSYDVPEFKPLPGVQYWELSTGSRIGYIKLPAKGIKKPCPIIYIEGGPGGFMTPKAISVLGNLCNDGYDVYLYDQVGSGHSARLENINGYTVARHKKDLEEIVAKTGAGKVILLGQSWGAMLATNYIADNADKVYSLIFSGPGPILPVKRGLSQAPAPDSLNLKSPPFSNAEANSKAANARTATAKFMANIFGMKLMPDAEADNFQTYLNRELNKATVSDTTHKRETLGGGGYYAQLMTVKSFDKVKDSREKLTALAIPVLVLRGQYDNQKWGYTAEYLTVFKNSILVVIPGAGHAITAEKEADYLKAIRKFLADNP